MDSDAFLLDHFKAPVSLKKGPWTAAEDAILIAYVQKHGEGNWNAVQKHSGLSRCGKSCRLRWANHLRPNLKKCAFSPDEERLIIELHQKLGNKWARMAAQLPGRTDNEIKNYWNTRIKRRMRAGLPIYPERDAVQSSSSSLHRGLSSNLTKKLARDDKTSSSSSSNNGRNGSLNLPPNSIKAQKPNSIKAQKPCLPQFRLPQLLPELPSGQFLESASNRLLSEAHSYGGSNTNNFLLEALLQDQQLLSNHSLGINSTEMNHWIKPASFSCSNQLASHSTEVSAFTEETRHEWNLMPPTLNGNCMKLESSSFTEIPIAVNYTDEELSTLLDFAKPDPASLPEWYNHNLIVAEAPNQFLDLRDAASELEQLLSGQAATNQVWEQLESCQWNNMPGVCQTSETYTDSCAIY